MSIVDGSFSMWVSDTTIMAHCDADWVEPSTPSDKTSLSHAGLFRSLAV